MTHSLLYPGKETQYPQYRRLAGPPGQSGWVQKIMSIVAAANLFVG